MKPLIHTVTYSIACMACVGLGLGWALRAEKTSEGEQGISSSSSSSAPAPPPTPVTASKAAEILLPTPARVVQRLLADIPTPELWSWLGRQPAEDDSLPQEPRLAVMQELVDRQGWPVLDQALSTLPLSLPDSPSPGHSIRAAYTGHLLTLLARQDLWRAWDFYLQHRTALDARWTEELNVRALAASAKQSAGKMLEVLRTPSEPIPRPNRPLGLYAPDFDFAQVLNALAASDAMSSAIVPDDLLVAWATRKPMEAVTWLENHPRFSEKSMLQGVDTGGVVQTVINLPEQTPGRTEALKRIGLNEEGDNEEEPDDGQEH